MLVPLRIFRIIIIVSMICCFICNNKTKKPNEGWQYLRIANWLFYLCGIASSTLSLGIDYPLDAISILFVCACIVSVVIMFIQRMWLIKYNDKVLIFRNSFGIKKRYEISKLSVVTSDRIDKIYCDNKKVIEWDTVIMNINESIALIRTINFQGKKTPRIRYSKRH